MNADEILFRCSSLGYIMTEGERITEKQLIKLAELRDRPKARTALQEQELQMLIAKRDAPPELAQTVKTHLVDVFVSAKYNRFTEINGKQLDKGNEVEEDSITTVSLITKTFYTKNESHLKNEFIKGTPDLFKGEDIYKSKIIRDCKSSWDIYTFNRAISKPLDPKYYWQGMGYLALTGAEVCYIDYCLNNTPWHLIQDELRKESYKYKENNTPAWIEAQIIANHVYDKKTFDEYINFRGLIDKDENCKAVIMGFTEVPLSERHFAFEFERNESDILKIYNRVVECREWLNKNLFKAETQTVAA